MEDEAMRKDGLGVVCDGWEVRSKEDVGEREWERNLGGRRGEGGA